jgi:hypothetical protein
LRRRGVGESFFENDSRASVKWDFRSLQRSRETLPGQP